VRANQRAERLKAGLNVAANAVCVHNRAGRALRSSQRATGAEGGSQARRNVFLGRASHTAALCCLGDVVAGVPLKVVSEVFGHASVAVTGDIYGHVSPEASREALTRLSDALS
jgi:integrase